MAFAHREHALKEGHEASATSSSSLSALGHEINQFCPLHAPVMMYFFTQSNRVDQSQTKSTKTESKQTVSLCTLVFFYDIKVTES